MTGDVRNKLIAQRYRLVDMIGRGGMGMVWRAWDEILGREVAVKEVLSPPGLSDAELELMNRRAVREARSAARLSHPGVVTVFDVAEQDGRPWVVMELLQARSLQEVIVEEGPLPPARVARIGRQTLAALGAAHAVGILHRDVKPSNVLLATGDRATLTDFGIAVIEGEATLTQSGGVIGSPSYIAPERIRGERATPASDLWALGATLYAAVEGRPPFQRTDPVAVFGAILAEEPVLTEKAGPLRPVIEGLLCKHPDHRLPAGVADAILLAIAGEGPAPWRPLPEATRTLPYLAPPETTPQPPPPHPDRPYPHNPPRGVTGVDGVGASRVAGAAGVAGAAAFGGVGLMALGAGVAFRGGALGVLAWLGVVHLLVAVGLYAAGGRTRRDLVTLVAGVVGAVSLPAVLVADPRVFGVLWSATGVWLGLSGLALAGRSRMVAVAGEAAAGLWILLISVPTLSVGGRAAVLLGCLAAYGVWAVGVGRLLRVSAPSNRPS